MTGGRILFFVPSDYALLQAKGVTRMVSERDEDGFFERVVTVHPLAFHRRTIDLDASHRIVEYDLGATLLADRPPLLGLLVAPFWLALIAVRAARLVRRERIDVIRATDVYLMGLLAWVVSRLTGVPFCVSMHADYDKRFELNPRTGLRAMLRRLASRTASFVLRRADMVLPIRLHLADWAIARGAKPERVKLIPHGIDLAPFPAPDALSPAAPWRPLVVSVVGRLAADNYASDVLEVGRGLVRTRRDVLFVVVGDGPEMPRFQGAIRGDPTLAASMRLLGFQPYERVIEVRRSSAVALALMGGFSLLEACAAACPAVTYDVEWHRDLVVDGQTGFLVREGDIEDVIRKVNYLLDHPDEAARMGAEARRRVFAEHDIRRTSRLKREAYEWLLNSRAPRSRPERL